MPSIILLASLMMAFGCATQTAAPIEDHPLQTIGTRDIEAMEVTIRPAIEEARRTYPSARRRFLSGLPEGSHFFVTTRLRDAGGSFEQIFVLVDRIDERGIAGRVASEVLTLSTFEQGQAIEVAESDIIDWTIVDAKGTEEGNFVGKLIDRIERRSH